MRRTGIVRDARFLIHKTGVHHIEVPQRLETIYNMIDKDPLKGALELIPPRFATLEELEMVHDGCETIRVNKVAEIADSEGHHPDISIYYRRVNLTLYTHAISGLSENDFIVAAKINNLGQM